MKRFSIKNETEALVNKAKPHIKEITPHIALNIFDIIQCKLLDEYENLCGVTKKAIVNQWIGKAIMVVFNLRHKCEHVTIRGGGHLIKSYTVFYL